MVKTSFLISLRTPYGLMDLRRTQLSLDIAINYLTEEYAVQSQSYFHGKSMKSRLLRCPGPGQLLHPATPFLTFSTYLSRCVPKFIVPTVKYVQRDVWVWVALGRKSCSRICRICMNGRMLNLSTRSINRRDSGAPAAIFDRSSCAEDHTQCATRQTLDDE